MPNTTSAKKRVRQTQKRTARNRRWKKAIKVSLKLLRDQIKTAKEPEDIKEELKNLQKITDKTALKEVIHKNKAARIKKRISKTAKRDLNKKNKKK